MKRGWKAASKILRTTSSNIFYEKLNQGIVFQLFLRICVRYRLSYYFLFLLQLTRMCVSSVTQSCPTLCDPMNCSPPGPSVHGILQARMLEWVALSSSRGSSQSQGSNLVLLFYLLWILHLWKNEAPGSPDGCSQVFYFVNHGATGFLKLFLCLREFVCFIFHRGYLSEKHTTYLTNY